MLSTWRKDLVGLKLEHQENFWNMKTKVTTKKSFDAVELQHKLRTEIGIKIEGLNSEEEIQFFKKAAERAKQRRASK